MIRKLLSKHFNNKIKKYKTISKKYNFFNFILFYLLYILQLGVPFFITYLSLAFSLSPNLFLIVNFLPICYLIFLCFYMKKIADSKKKVPNILLFIIKYLNSKLYNRLIKAIKYSDYYQENRFNDVIQEISKMNLKELYKYKKFIVNNISIFNNHQQMAIIKEINISIDFFENQEERILKKYKENKQFIKIKEEKTAFENLDINKIHTYSDNFIFYHFKDIVKESDKLTLTEKKYIFKHLEERINLYIEKNKILEKENEYIKNQLIKNI